MRILLLICISITTVLCHHNEILIRLTESEDADSLAKLVERTHTHLILKKHLFGNYYLFESKKTSSTFDKRELNTDDLLALDNNIAFYERQKLVYITKRSNELENEKLIDLRKRLLDYLIKEKSIDYIKSKSLSLCKRTEDYPYFNDESFKSMWEIFNEGQNGGMCGNDLNILPCWSAGYTGKGVIVSVLDDGVQHSHPDLIKNYYPDASWDFNGDDNDPTPNMTNPHNSHGTKCAGVIAAEANNSVCAVGIAHEASFAAVRVLDGPIYTSMLAEALLYKHEQVDIYSASWGPPDDGKAMDGPKGGAIEDAFEKGATEGRGGLGSIYILANGNGGNDNDTCSADGFVGNIHTIPIGAITEGGTRAFFSESCPATFAVVYTGGFDVNKKYRYPLYVTTDDVQGGCTKKFIGTSSAAPLAAGMVALALQANPNLTNRDVQHLIIATAKIPTDEDRGWFRNGGGFTFNQGYGAGVLDGAAMVAGALNWINVPPQMKGGIEKTINSKILAPKTSDEILCDHFDFNFDGIGENLMRIVQLEHVLLEVRIETKFRGQVAIDLFSPSNTHSRILEYRTKDYGTDLDFEFSTIHNWGEDPKGPWTTKVCNHDSENDIFVVRLKLTFYGTSKPFSKNLNTISKRLDKQELMFIMNKEMELSKRLLLQKREHNKVKEMSLEKKRNN